MNKYTGVLGIYNCQGAAWNITEGKNTFHQTHSDAITDHVKGRDVHKISDIALDYKCDGNDTMYTHTTGYVIALPFNIAMPVSLKVLEHEIYTITPVKVLADGFSSAPFGLINVFNSGGAIEVLKYEVKGGANLVELESRSNDIVVIVVKNLRLEVLAIVSLELKGGRFGAYSSTKPRKCVLGSSAIEFEFDSMSRFMTLNLSEMSSEEHKVHFIKIEL